MKTTEGKGIRSKNKFETKKERELKYAHEFLEESIKKNKGNYSRYCFTPELHPYECDILICNRLDEHIWYDLQVIKSLLINHPTHH